MARCSRRAGHAAQPRLCAQSPSYRRQRHSRTKTADVHGVMVRYEPLPHKNTLGFWVRADDWVSWEFDINQPQTFRVEILQGCGTGSGGSQVEFAVGDQKLMVTIEETGGFQNFVHREIGTMNLDKRGRHTLTARPRSKPGPAVMDLREVRLVPE